jgi:hypothetical protein
VILGVINYHQNPLDSKISVPVIFVKDHTVQLSSSCVHTHTHTVPVISARHHHCAAVIVLWLLCLHVHRASSRCSPQKLIDTNVSWQRFWHVTLQGECRDMYDL